MFTPPRMDWLLAFSFFFWGVYTTLVLLLQSQTDYEYGLPTIVLVALTSTLLWLSSHHRSQNTAYSNFTTFTNAHTTTDGSATATDHSSTSASPKNLYTTDLQRILEVRIMTLKSRNNNLIANLAGVLDEIERHDEDIHGRVETFLSQGLYPKSVELVQDALKTGSWRKTLGEVNGVR